MQFMCLACVCLVIISTSFITRITGQLPSVLPYKSDITLKKGDKLRLICPIVSSTKSSFFYEWKKDTKTDLELSTKFSFENDSRILRSEVPMTVDDSGIYSCKGITGFGTKTVEFNVKIIDRSQKQLCATNKSNNPKLEAPCFVDPIMKNGSRPVNGEKGSYLELSCQASGTKPMDYHWFFGPNSANWIETKDGVNKPVLKIVSLKPNYNGQLRCQVSNEAGILNYTYRLIVTEPMKNKPKILTELSNKTFSVGDVGTIKLMVKCECKGPIVKWLKRVNKNTDPPEIIEKAFNLPTYRESEKNEYFSSIEHGVVTKELEPNLFESTITLGPITPRSSGKYIVTAINSALGFKKLEYEVVYVNVKDDNTKSKMKNNLVIYISVPVVILLSTVLMVIFCCLRRHATSSQGYSRSNNTSGMIINGGSNNNSTGGGYISQMGGGGGSINTTANGYRSSSSRRQTPCNNNNNNNNHPYGNGGLLPSNGNGSSHTGSEKIKPPSTNSTVGMTTQQAPPPLPPPQTMSNGGGGGGSNTHHQTSSQQSPYDQYSVLSVSQSSQSTPPQYFHNSNPSSIIALQQQQQQHYPQTQHYVSAQQQYHQQLPYQQQIGYMPVPMNQYPA